ncbi:DUF4062 domain-containing protein [Paraneptunicella aestuarii]|uniref:DUF4062 domain-containing protein n=1 Tax=Paraneptunicella aestuarii TaxID=2831148 RepID=UPI001E48759C|nr:DUF4062 domain-containing protein [Paraneptunicella aestuarii]UAA40555.1 DUF4062 domain-containing protein [Paraneptunicella aestuarii]
MAAPKVFVSSTCFDLSEIREQLRRFIISYGFEPILSENGDVFYHPELHTHEACVNEVSNCQLFILIIGGRFGGEYIADKTKSITNAEYKAARESGIPVFTYVRKGVLNCHHTYQHNKKKEFVSDIKYPSIEKQEYALDIFSFIDEVRRAPRNNAFEGFDGFASIENHLRKQWAGMFYELLKTQEVKSQIDVTNHLIEGIGTTSRKLEELIKSLYMSSNKEEAEEKIIYIDVYSDVVQFFEEALYPKWSHKSPYYWDMDQVDVHRLADINVTDCTWVQYLLNFGLFDVIYDDNSDEELLISESDMHVGRNDSFAISTKDIELKQLFENGVKKSTAEQRIKALKYVFGNSGVSWELNSQQ